MNDMSGGTAIACAECGCRVDRGIRVAVCADRDCCCGELPVRRAETPSADPPAE